MASIPVEIYVYKIHVFYHNKTWLKEFTILKGMVVGKTYIPVLRGLER